MMVEVGVVVAVAVMGRGQWSWWWLGGVEFVWLFFNGFVVGFWLNICWICGGFGVIVVAMWRWCG